MGHYPPKDAFTGGSRYSMVATTSLGAGLMGEQGAELLHAQGLTMYTYTTV